MRRRRHQSAQRRRDQGPAHADTQGKGDVGALRRRGAREGRAGARCASGRRGRGSGPALWWAPGAGEVLDLGDQLGGGGRRAVTQPGPQVATDLPGGAKRLKQKASGIKATVVAGQVLLRDGEHTGALPGRLLRSR